MSEKSVVEKYNGKIITICEKPYHLTSSNKVFLGTFEMPTWQDAELFLREARHKKRFVYGSITDDPKYRGYILKIALDPSGAEDRKVHIKRRIYDSSAYYPGSDEVHEFYIIRQTHE